VRLRSALLAELRHRWPSALVSAGAVALAIASVVVFVLLGRAAEDETRILQRDIGLNVLVLSDQTDLGKYYAKGYSEHSLPMEYLDRLWDQEVANRLVPMIRWRLTLDPSKTANAAGLEILLTGIGAEVFKAGKSMKAVFGMQLESDEVVIGGEVAASLGLTRGDELELMGKRFRVQRSLRTAGSEEDVTVYANLGTVQTLLGLEGRINEIQAIECHCAADIADPLEHLRSQLEQLLPGTRVIRRAALADARRAQRISAKRLLKLATPAAVLLAGALVAALAWLNTRDRRAELGLLRTLGASSAELAGLVIGRSLLIGCLGALLGSAGGEWLALELIPRIYSEAKSPPMGQAMLWLYALLGAPLFAAGAALLPVAWAVSADPAEVLCDE
jgi:hypothetical protein